MDSALKETIDFLRTQSPQQPALGLVLGSGLGSYVDQFKNSTVFPYSRIPHFPCSGVSGHPGNLVIGSVGETACIALQGRIHYYEGHSMQDIAFPIRVFAGLGTRKLIVTNAAGGVNPDFEPGDLMLIEDHINMMGSNPLIGYLPEEPMQRFADMSCAYDPDMRKCAMEVARENSIPLRKGIYLAVSGPCYETPAEVNAYRCMGADAVGMSTVPEVIAAIQCGIRVLGLSCITNMAAGIHKGAISHSEVLETTRKTEAIFRTLLDGIIKAG